MFIQTIKATQVIAFIFISVAASAQSAQSYHQPVKIGRFDEQGVSDPKVAAHLQVSIIQPENNVMKFRVVVENPFNKSATITICKGDDVLYSEGGVRGQYQNLFNLDRLEDGKYQIIVTSGKETIRKEIDIHTETRIDRQAQLN